MILLEISDVTTTSVSPSAGSVMAPMTVVTAQMRGTAVSVQLPFFVFALFSLALSFGYGSIWELQKHSLI